MKTLLALLLAFLAACAPEQGHCPRLPGGGRYCLQPPSDQPFSTLQKTSIQFGGQTLTLLTRIESDATGLRFVGLTPFGQTLMSVSWENGTLRAELPPALQGKLDPALLLALIQIAHWPADQVRAGLGPQWIMTETPATAPNRRQLKLTQNDESMLNIRWSGPAPYALLHIEAPAAGFRMESVRLDDSDDSTAEAGKP